MDDKVLEMLISCFDDQSDAEQTLRLAVAGLTHKDLNEYVKTHQGKA